jgi:hypothetical protein
MPSRPVTLQWSFAVARSSKVIQNAIHHSEHNKWFTAHYKCPTCATFGYTSITLPPAIWCANDKSPRTAKSNVGRYISVRIATRYGLDVRVRMPVEAHPSRPVLGLTQPSHNGCWIFPRGKAAGAWH